jgi:hypothetical protein
VDRGAPGDAVDLARLRPSDGGPVGGVLCEPRLGSNGRRRDLPSSIDRRLSWPRWVEVRTGAFPRAGFTGSAALQTQLPRFSQHLARAVNFDSVWQPLAPALRNAPSGRAISRFQIGAKGSEYGQLEAFQAPGCRWHTLSALSGGTSRSGGGRAGQPTAPSRGLCSSIAQL